MIEEDELTGRLKAYAEERRGVNEPTALYRLYDADHELLYVGITKNLGQRWVAHRRDKRKKPWWGQVDHREITWYKSRPDALFAEHRAIVNERPLHNSPGDPQGLRPGLRRSGGVIEPAADASGRTQAGKPDLCPLGSAEAQWWTMNDIAAYLQIGYGTVRLYRGGSRPGRALPAEDTRIDDRPLWKPATIIRWNETERCQWGRRGVKAPTVDSILQAAEREAVRQAARESQRHA